LGRRVFRRGGGRGGRWGVTASCQQGHATEQCGTRKKPDTGFMVCHVDVLSYWVVVVVELLDVAGAAGDCVVVVELLSLEAPSESP
jgi:hypothetical protein